MKFKLGLSNILQTDEEYDLITLELQDPQDPSSRFIPIEVNGHPVFRREDGRYERHDRLFTRAATDQEREWYSTGKYIVRDGQWCKVCRDCQSPLPLTDQFWELQDGEPIRSYCRECFRIRNRRAVQRHRQSRKR